MAQPEGGGDDHRPQPPHRRPLHRQRRAALQKGGPAPARCPGLIHHVRDPRSERRKARNKEERARADEEGYLVEEVDAGVDPAGNATSFARRAGVGGTYGVGAGVIVVATRRELRTTVSPLAASSTSAFHVCCPSGVPSSATTITSQMKRASSSVGSSSD